MNEQTIAPEIVGLLNSNNSKNNLEIITDYLLAEPGTMTLTPKQQKLLERWSCADDLIRKNNKLIKEIAHFIANKFQVDISTAWRDIDNARSIFGSTRPSNKKYLLMAHVDRIHEDMIFLRKIGDYKNLGIMYKEYTNAIDKLPDDDKASNAAPPVVFNIQFNNYNDLTSQPVTEAEAIEIAEKFK